MSKMSEEIAVAITEALKAEGAVTKENICEIVAGKAFDLLPVSFREDAEQAFYLKLRLPELCRELRKGEFPMATLVRRRYFTEFRDIGIGVQPEQAGTLVAGTGPGTVAAGIAVDDAVMFNAAKEKAALKANGIVRTVTEESDRAIQTKTAGPAQMHETAAALDKMKTRLDAKPTRKWIDRALTGAPTPARAITGSKTR